MILEGFKHLVEFIVPECLDIIVPSGKVQPCDGRLCLLIENADEFKEEGPNMCRR